LCKTSQSGFGLEANPTGRIQKLDLGWISAQTSNVKLVINYRVGDENGIFTGPVIPDNSPKFFG
jgi:hypothetical protein